MAQAAVAYQQPVRRTREQENPSRQPQPRRARPALKVVPGRAAANQATRGLAPVLRTVITCGVIVLLVFCAFVIASVSLSAVTYSLSASSEKTIKEIETQRSKNEVLESSYSQLANRTAIQEAANLLGMSPATEVDDLRIAAGE